MSGEAGAETTRHAVTSSEPSTQAPADSLPQYQHRMLDVPPSDYITKPLQTTVDKVIHSVLKRIIAARRNDASIVFSVVTKFFSLSSR